MTLLQLLKLALTLSIFLTVFALAMRARVADMFYLFRHWRLGLGAFAAMYVAVPAVAIAMCLMLPLDPAIKIALIAISVSPMPPILPGKQLKAGAEPSYVAGLMVATTALAIPVAPLGVALVSRVFDVQVSIPPGPVALVIAITVAAPLVLGLAAGAVLGGRAHAISSVIGVVGHVVLALSVLAYVVILGPSMWTVITSGGVVALLALIVAGMGVGYVLGGPNVADKQALSLAAAARHPGVAVAIANTTFPDEHLSSAAIVLSLLLASVLCMPFLRMFVPKAGEPVEIKGRSPAGH